MKFADLHVHTHYSDSTFSPEEVVYHAKKQALSAIAICDHDCVDGVQPTADIAAGSGLEILSGIELTVEKTDAEIHLLGYLVDITAPWFLKRLAELQRARIERTKEIVMRLNRAGVAISCDDVLTFGGKGTIGRLHIARALLRAGIVKEIRQAFERYIGFGKPCYVSNVRFTPEEALELVLRAGGVPVLAHPGLIGDDSCIPELVAHGLRGIEVYHSDHKPNAVKRYEALAKEYNLIMTGGSDCHGLGKGRVLLGTVRVPYTVVEELKDAAKRA